MWPLLTGQEKEYCSAAESELFPAQSDGVIKRSHRFNSPLLQWPESALMTATIFAAVDAKPDTIQQVEGTLRRMVPLT